MTTCACPFTKDQCVNTGPWLLLLCRLFQSKTIAVNVQEKVLTDTLSSLRQVWQGDAAGDGTGDGYVDVDRKGVRAFLLDAFDNIKSHFQVFKMSLTSTSTSTSKKARRELVMVTEHAANKWLKTIASNARRTMMASSFLKGIGRISGAVCEMHQDGQWTCREYDSGPVSDDGDDDDERTSYTSSSSFDTESSGEGSDLEED